MNHILAWEGEYKRKGKLWRGVAEIEDIEGSLQRNLKILEIGCGNGKTLVQLLERGYDAVGIDVSREALKLGQAIAFTGDARYLPFLNSSFDAVVCRFVLEHLYEGERAQAAAEMRRVLRQSGLLFLRAFSTEDMRCSLSQERWRYRQVVRKTHGLAYASASLPNGIQSLKFASELLSGEQNTFRRASGIICHYFTEFELINLLRKFQILSFEVNREKNIFDGKEYLRASFCVTAAKGEEIDRNKERS